MEDIVYQAISLAHYATSYASSITESLYNTFSPLREYVDSQPDLMNVALLLLIVYLSLSILGMASRWIYGVLVTTIRLLFILFIVAAGAWIWQRGGAARGDLERLVDMVGKATSGAGAGAGARAAGGREWADKYAEY
ncbi:hypothetical protein Q9L58_007380 [Maublancomyces gigas]|uniref:Uncharacterized protein n=1 Tax=Discina gigas TaxID=1032678 RepID=A0ABR3GCL0_9PEZI